ncbi:phosphatase regulatory subunit [Penicillium concentricum]|uniref:Phosphatase regulatory subunit n=1 Tax=Penicillium concentricum TaxID=293559 RepID=A0A9W9VJC2_9EURO|nr:phosphatase regulatory subunit [Penicillium concentricum]KAJ5384042.1 phosphatase regulatory subunit [Penicillium concentricum]
MPYTAPSKTLLAAQHIEYSKPTEPCERPGLARSSSGRVQTSRSYSSTSYTRRHRRSPSNTKPTVHSAPESPARASPSIDPHASLRQSPPPISNAIIPPGAVISPPESALNSSDEESPYRSGEGVKFDELEAAVRSIKLRRESSPERMGQSDPETSTRPSSAQSTETKPTRPKLPQLPLSKEARKITHSRSSTETAIELAREQALTSSPEESDVEMSCKPPMVRKKSGELVRPALRPSSARRRPSSMPGTPVYSKAVHFDSHLEHIRHFLQLDRPLAVSTETSPVENHDSKAEFPFGSGADSRGPSWEWEIKLANWPKDISSRDTRPVRLERLFLSADKNTLIGTVAVANLAFHKNVTARFTLDYWRTTSEVAAAYCHDVRRQQVADGFDRFSFDLKLNDQANLETKTMFMCIRYNVAGQEYWDNNDTVNYQVDFHKVPKTPASKPPSGGSRPALPRSRSFTSSHSMRPHSMPPTYDFPDLSDKKPFTNSFNNANGTPLTRTPSDEIDTVEPPKRRENSKAFGNRYDFGASLSAAMRSKAPLDRTALTARARSGETVVPETSKPTKKTPRFEQGPTSAVSDNIRTGARVEDLKPSSLVSSKPQLESSVYQELVDKYCFYGSPQGSNLKAHPSISSGREGEAPKHISAPACPSPPLSPRSPAPLSAPVAVNPRASPRPSASPLSFRYSFNRGFMTDPHSPTVIRGGFDQQHM